MRTRRTSTRFAPGRPLDDNGDESDDDSVLARAGAALRESNFPAGTPTRDIANALGSLVACADVLRDTDGEQDPVVLAARPLLKNAVDNIVRGLSQMSLDTNSVATPRNNDVQPLTQAERYCLTINVPCSSRPNDKWRVGDRVVVDHPGKRAHHRKTGTVVGHTRDYAYIVFDPFTTRSPRVQKRKDKLRTLAPP